MRPRLNYEIKFDNTFFSVSELDCAIGLGVGPVRTSPHKRESGLKNVFFFFFICKFKRRIKLTVHLRGCGEKYI